MFFHYEDVALFAAIIIILLVVGDRPQKKEVVKQQW
jgi:hypothetical protein